MIHTENKDCGLKKINMTCAMVLDVDRSRNEKLEFYHVCSTTGKNASVAGTLDNEFCINKRQPKLG